jgi:thioesterase domain-containing protein/acyl carrier protein
MIPSDFMFLTSLPLTNGKLDRTALPKPERSRPDLTKPYVPPRTEIEKKLVQIWENVLNVQPVGIQDNFFDLGGHSLIASRLFLEIEKAYGKTFPLTTLYWARTIEKLARVLEQDNWAAPWSLLFPIQLKGSKPPFFWVYGETSDALLPRYLGPEQPVYGLMHECRTGKQVRHTQLVDIAANHLQEIRLVQPRGPYYLGGFCFGGMVAFEIAQQLRQQGEEVALLFLLDLATIKNCSFLLGQNPGSETMSAKLKSLRDEVCRHFHYLAALPPREQFTYVRVRAMDRARKMFRYSKIVSKKIVRNFYFAVHHDLPLSFHEQYISEVDRHAVANYKPQPYWGRVLFFKANGGSYDDQLVAKLVGDGLEAHEVQCGHSEIIKEPYIRVWAEKLKSCLSEAQAKVP